MSRNATASWSGYSHQGKIGILVALRKIRELNRAGLDNYYIEYETQEDVKMVNDDNIIEVHQVKAQLNAHTIGTYTTALRNFEACNGLNCLHTICEITNWDELTQAQNPRVVERYPYTNTRNYCTLDHIESYVLAEIHAILVQIAHPQAENAAWQKDAYLECLGILDDCIRHEHATKTQDEYQVRILLSNILACLEEPPNHKRMITCAIRRKIYQQYVDFIQGLDNSTIILPPDHEAFVSGIIEKICLLNDKALENFLNQIFPHSTLGETLGTTALTDSFFVSDAFFSPFLLTLIRVQNTPLTLEGDTYPHYRADVNYLLTAIQTPNIQMEQVAKKILIHDKLNAARYEAHFVITEHYSGRLVDIAQRLLDKGKGILAPNDLVFITAQAAIQTLN